MIAGLERGVTVVAAGQYHLCAIVDGAVKCLSLDSSGTPTALSIGALDGPAIAVGVGAFNACALLAGRVQCWGLGDTRFRGQPPRVVEGLPPDVTGLSVGWMHACALSRGSVWCWGDNQFGQLGYESSENCEDSAGDMHACSRRPARVVGLP